MNINKPTLLIDLEKVDRNIQRIAEKGRQSDTNIVPHFKTHQSHQVGEIFKKNGINSITVSSVTMATYFVEAGWKSVYIAFPVNVLEIDSIDKLAGEVDLTLLVDNHDQVKILIDKLKHTVSIKLEIECGSNRSGLDPADTNTIQSLIEAIINSKHRFDGFYSHFGHTYKAESPKDVDAIYQQSIRILFELKNTFNQYKPKIGTGDTPSASVLTDYKELDAVHAGNYVFYDLTQSQIGVCSETDIAIALAAPVVSKNSRRKELVLYGGGIHLSKENMLDRVFGVPIFGKLVKLTESGWTDSLESCYLRSISQEHGIAKVTDQVFNEVEVGDVLGILPVHSCMTADCMHRYIDLQGNKIDHLQGLVL